MAKVDFSTSLYRTIISSGFATGVDFATMVFCTEILGIYYVYSTAIGATAGAIVGFFFCRIWAFKRTDQGFFWQAFRYGLASFIIMNVNVAGVYFFTENMEFNYQISRILIALFAGLFVSFPLFRFFVYK